MYSLADRMHACCRGNRIRKAVTNILMSAIKRAVMSPAYMKDAWRKELEMIAEDGLTPEEMLVLALEEGSETMPFFAGCSVYPIFPGAAAKWVCPACPAPPYSALPCPALPCPALQCPYSYVWMFLMTLPTIAGQSV